MSRIPIKSVKALANETGQDLVIVFAIDTDGETQHIATWGRSIEDCSRAADWGNKMKDKLEWPKSLHAQPSRVKKLQARVKELETLLGEKSEGISMSKPITDAELDKKLESILLVIRSDIRQDSELWKAIGLFTRGGDYHSTFVDLIKDYAIAHADEVIGEDNEWGGSDDADAQINDLINKLKAIQRERNK